MNSVTRVLLSTLTATFLVLACVNAAMAHPQATATEAKYPPTTEGDFVVHNFKFKSGQSMSEVRLHYTTLGKPAQDARRTRCLFFMARAAAVINFSRRISQANYSIPAKFSTHRATTSFS